MIDHVIDQLSYIESLPAYDTCSGNIDRIQFAVDLTKVQSDYYYKGWASPIVNPSTQGNADRMDPLQTFEEVISIPPGSFLVALSAYSEQENRKFAWNIEEVESQSMLSLNNSSMAQNLGNFEGVAVDTPRGPSWSWPYFVVGARGLIKVTLINLSTSANRIQLFMEFAVPTNSATMQRTSVKVA
jgi:hypothetical protein